MGHYLKTMARSAAIETHLQSISNSLIVDINKLWMPPEPEEVNDTDFVDFQCFKSFSVWKGKPILPWESYRDWLMLMVHYFDATEVLHDFASKLKIEPNAAISITVLTPSLSNRQMIPWTELPENKHLFPVIPVVSSGRDLIEFLNNPVNINEVLSNIIRSWRKVDAFLPVEEVLLAHTIAKPILPPSLPPWSVMSRIAGRVWIHQI